MDRSHPESDSPQDYEALRANSPDARGPFALASVEDVHRVGVRVLGLDSSAVDLVSPEAIACLLRRAASFDAPCTARTLRERVHRGLEGLAEDREALRERLDAVIESLAVYGDLLELPTSQEDDTVSLLHLAPPTFVWQETGVAFLLGGLPDGVDGLPADLRERVYYVSHTRRLYAQPGEDLRERLRRFGLINLPNDLWLAAPRRDTSVDTIARANRGLEQAPTRGEVAGLMVLDPDRPVRYYKGRWTESAGRTGRFIGRREQRYGADLWCYVELANGNALKLLDLPRQDLARTGWRACDDAWHLQLAIDALTGHPQEFRIRHSAPSGSVVLDFFSPVPLWARRRWDVLGELVEPASSLFSYRFPVAEFEAERSFLKECLWLIQRT